MTAAGGRRAVAGTSLIEVMLVLVVMGITAGMAVPRYALASEQAHVDAAAASLRSVWLAQRLWWLEEHAFCGSLEDLAERHLVDAPLLAGGGPFELDLLSADEGAFQARMLRRGSGHWSGELVIDQSGQITGTISSASGQHVLPHGS